VAEAGFIDFADEQFEVGSSLGLMPLMKLAKAAQGGTDANEMAGLAALYDVLEECIAPSDWQRFQGVATKSKASGDALQNVVKDAVQAIAARPTGLSSDSSDGLTPIPPSSEDASYLRVVKRLEDQGRPDNALMVLMANEARSA